MPNYFEILDLPTRYDVSSEELEARFHEASKRSHPDRHMRADGATRVKSALATAELNRAYRTLRDPVQRAEYLLTLCGVVIADERGGKKVAPSFLMEMMELRESLAEARAERDERRVLALANDVRTRRDRELATVAERFAAAGSIEAARDDRNLLQAIADSLVALRYFHRFLEEIERHEDERDGARP